MLLLSQRWRRADGEGEGKLLLGRRWRLRGRGEMGNHQLLLLPRWGLGLRVFGGGPYDQIDGGEDWAHAELELRTVTDFK